MTRRDSERPENSPVDYFQRRMGYAPDRSPSVRALDLDLTQGKNNQDSSYLVEINRDNVRKDRKDRYGSNKTKTQL